MKTILFQGDSITDARRDRNKDEYNGMGYATMCVGKFRFPCIALQNIFESALDEAPVS